MSKFTCLSASLTIGLVLAGFANTAEAILIQPVGVHASSEWSSLNNGIALHTIDGSGLDGSGAGALHTNGYPIGGGASTQWHTQAHAMGNPTGEWITFDLGDRYDLTSILIWNFSNETASADETARGIQNFNLIASGNDIFGDGDDFVINGLVLAKVEGVGGPGWSAAQVFALDATDVRYVRLNPLTNYGDSYTGLAEVRFEGTLVPEPASLALLGAAALLLSRRRRD